MQVGTITLKIGLAVSITCKHMSTHDAAFPLVNMHPAEMHTYVHQKAVSVHQ